MDAEIPTDDEEVMIPPHDRIKEVPDFPDSNVRDEQTLLSTQREDWLLSTEPLHGARPRQTGRERPPVIRESTTYGSHRECCQLEARPGPPVVAGTADLEEEVITPQRGGGGRPAPEPQGPPRGVRVVPNPFPNDFLDGSLRNGDLDRQDIGSPVDVLVNTVARMQKDIATLRE